MLRWLVVLSFLYFITGCSVVPVDSEDGDIVTPAPTPTLPVSVCENAQSKSLNAPWKDSSTTIVIDAYYLNSIDWDAMARDKRVAAVIHKSSEGLRTDSKYSERRQIALNRGYLWGAYHLGDRSDPVKQADHFLTLVGKDDLMVLDLEDTSSSRFMTLDQALVFMKRVFEKTGKVPTIYANHSTAKLINTKFKNESLIKNAKFWYARFKSNVTDFPKGVWQGYFLWQFSSEINCSRTGSCLYNVPGTKYDMDVNVFDGTKSELEACWKN